MVVRTLFLIEPTPAFEMSPTLYVAEHYPDERTLFHYVKTYRRHGCQWDSEIVCCLFISVE